MAQKPENRVNLFRLQILIIDGGLLVLRNIIDQNLTAQGITLSACLNNEMATIKRLKNRGIITQVQYDQLFPTSGHVPTTSDMDLTLIIFLLRCVKCFGLNKNFDWKATPISTDVSIEADICRLKAYRNEISHKPETTVIQAREFVSWWNDIEQILLRQSSPALNIQQTIADFKVCPLDPDEEKRVQDAIQKWKDYEADVDRLKEAMTEVKEKVTEVEKNLEEIKRRQDEDETRQDRQKNESMFQRFFEWIRYRRMKTRLKYGLFEFYKSRHSNIFLSPLFEEKDTPLASFYIRPELSSVVSKQTGNDVQIPVKSLSDVFKTANTEHREIYVLADAGIGKTAFSKYLANVWCQAHCPDEDIKKLLLKDDIDCMQEFDFLFLVLLRDSDDLCSIDELIFEKIVSNLGVEETISKDELLKILNKEKCLIILDGLDEWTHPDKICYRSPRSIPHRNDREKCTILTTTRPWKLGLLDLNSFQLGKTIALTVLSRHSAVTLIERIFKRWKSYPNKDALDSDVRQFMETISQRQNAELAFVPLLLIYTTCLWCQGVQIGNSKCDLYINIVELLLSRTIQIHGELKQLRDPCSSNLPECFVDYENCKKYYPLLISLGKLAYYALSNETKENTLVFDGSVAKKYLTGEDEMKFTLHSGMLSESTSKTARKKISKVSFSHKTVQEFFAAIFISSHSDAQKTVVEKCRNVQDILDMSIICEYVSEMNADRMCSISNDFMSVINEDKSIRDYRTGPCKREFKPFSPLYNIQNMLMSCLQEMPESQNIQLCLQDFFILQDTVHNEQLQRLLKRNKTNLKSLYINMEDTSSSLSEIIDSFSLTDLSYIQKVCYQGDKEKDAEINRILFPSLQSVSLLQGTWRNDEENLSENLPRVQNLYYLNIEEFKLSHKILETFFNYISCQKSLKELRLFMLYCKNHYLFCNRLNLDLSQHSTLTKLHLQDLPPLQLNIKTPSLVDVTFWRISLDEMPLLLSSDMLNIKQMYLGHIKMSAECLQNFIIVLKNLPHSAKVLMYNIMPETEYDRFKENIRSSQTFYVIPDPDPLGIETFEFLTKKPSKE